MAEPVHNPESLSDGQREIIAAVEPRAARPYSPALAVLCRSAGIYHWTPEGKRLYDFTSGVLVANLGHNPASWRRRFESYMGWSDAFDDSRAFALALPLTAYNATTPVEVEASRRLVELLRSRLGGRRLEQVMWAASGSEAIQKALWASLAFDRTRDTILATRFGFHGKKGLAGAVSGSEMDHDRDTRVRFLSFPMAECSDVSQRDGLFDPTPYQHELDDLIRQTGRRVGTLITEPYLGAGGSFHPPPAYLSMLQTFCRERDILFIVDEVQSNFGRTGRLFAFETYGIEPDIVVLGKGLANGVPVAAAVGRRDVFAALDYGQASDTWSGNPLASAAVLATLDEFANPEIMANCRRSSAIIEDGLARLKDLPFVANIRGERGGMVWGVEMCDFGGRTATDWANAFVMACYHGEANDGIHLLGPLAKRVIRVAPPLVIAPDEARSGMELMYRCVRRQLPDEVKCNLGSHVPQ